MSRVNDGREKKFYVYSLRVQYARQPFYIGKGSGNRVMRHFDEKELARKCHKSHIINQARADGKKIAVDFIEQELTNRQACLLETRLIKQYGLSNEGGILANARHGGESGNVGYRHTQEARDKIGAASRGKKRPQHVIDALVAANKARTYKPHTYSTREKMSASHTGTARGPMSDAQKEKLRQAHLGKTASPEARMRMSIAQAGRVVSEETRRKISEAQKGKPRGPMSQAHKDAISKGNKGKTMDPDAVRRASEKRRGQKRTPEQKERIRLGKLQAKENAK